MAAITAGCWVATAAASASAAVLADSQFWGEVDVTLPLTANLSLTAISMARSSLDADRPITYAGGLGVNVGVSETLTVTPFVKEYDVFSSSRQVWVWTRELGSDLTASWVLTPCELSDRSRVYESVAAASSRWVYRNRPQINCQVGPDRWGLSAYTAEELFHYSSIEAVTRFRWTLGTRMTLSRACVVDVYYLRQNDEVQLPRRVTALGVTIELLVAGAR